MKHTCGLKFTTVIRKMSFLLILNLNFHGESLGCFFCLFVCLFVFLIWSSTYLKIRLVYKTDITSAVMCYVPFTATDNLTFPSCPCRVCEQPR